MHRLISVFRAHMPVRVQRIKNRFLRAAAGVLVSPIVYARDFHYINFELRGKRRLYYVEVFLTPRCSLRCTYCAACMPSYTELYDIPYERIEASLCAFLDHIDYIENLRLLGGEPFAYRELDRVLRFVFGSAGELDALGADATDEKIMLRNAIITVAHKIYLDQLFLALRTEAK